MKKSMLRWLTIATLALSAPLLHADEADVDPREAIEATLDAKFAEGEYSRNGADGCMRCHDERSDKPAHGIFDNIHGKAANINGPMSDKQCEACHGPAGNHPRNPRRGQMREPMITFGDDSPVSIDKQNSVCMSCHTDNTRANWHSSVHAFEEVSCVNCHKVHQAEDPMFVKEEQVETCTSCHADVKSDIHKRSGHQLLNNSDMTCSSCHQPHDSVNEASLLKPTVNETCYDCHAEKRGPFVFEHEPVFEDCTTCHSPHGSINPAMLEKRLPQLCQDCHRVPHAQVEIPEDDIKLRGGSCMNCHTEIHGTNNPHSIKGRW